MPRCPLRASFSAKTQKNRESQIPKWSKLEFFQVFLVRKSHFSILGCQGDQCKFFCPYNLSSTYPPRYLQRVMDFRDFRVAVLQNGSIEYFCFAFFWTSLTPLDSPYPWLLCWSSKIFLRLGWGVRWWFSHIPLLHLQILTSRPLRKSPSK